ncbi:hypothetical protein Pcinc_005243 [Petrolisthes cinctipes]|uniref:Uncharacterized protein n=1 Tax=Petrolisthes cinctipes TaxID=88211 RepID=A0AAE1GJW2_PETCI|nr:hypothetical protein Pcinc_005243 [Petrolisthes cinctipes]
MAKEFLGHVHCVYGGVAHEYGTHSTSARILAKEQKFFEAMKDGYLYQHVTENTRGRGTNTPHLLDLMIMNEEGKVDNLNHLAPIGKSDHCCLQFKFNCRTVHQGKSYIKYYYDRGEYLDHEEQNQGEVARNKRGKE